MAEQRVLWLSAFTTSLGCCRCRYDLEFCSEWVCFEIPIADGINLLIGNCYFTPDTTPNVIADYFCLLENILYTNNFCVILLGDFNAPGFNWEIASPLPNCHNYSKLKGGAVYTSTCLLGLRQCFEPVDSHNFLDLVFANFTDVKSVPANFGLVSPYIYHPPLSIDVCLPQVNNNLNC